MAVPIGAILKKAAVALGSNKKVLKTIAGIALGIVVIVCMPIIALLGIFSGGADIEIDTGAVYDRIEGWQPDAESVFETVEEKMEESGLSEEQIKEIVLADETIRPLTEGKLIRKFIVVPGRLINIIV